MSALTALRSFLAILLIAGTPLATFASESPRALLTTVTIDGSGNLVVTDVGAKADALTIGYAAGTITITDGSDTISIIGACAGCAGDTTPVVTIPAVNVTGSILVDLDAGADVFIVTGAMPFDVDVENTGSLAVSGAAMGAGNNFTANSPSLVITAPVTTSAGGTVTLRGTTVDIQSLVASDGLLTIEQPAAASPMTLQTTAGAPTLASATGITVGDASNSGDVDIDYFTAGSTVPVVLQSGGTLTTTVPVTTAGAAPITVRGSTVDVQSLIGAVGPLTIEQPAPAASLTLESTGGAPMITSSASITIGDAANTGDVDVDYFTMPSAVPVTLQSGGTLTTTVPVTTLGIVGITVRAVTVDVQSLIGAAGPLVIEQPAPGIPLTLDSTGGLPTLGSATSITIGDVTNSGNVTIDYFTVPASVPVVLQTGGTLTMSTPVTTIGGATVDVFANVLDVQSLLAADGALTIEPPAPATSLTIQSSAGVPSLGSATSVTVGDNANTGNLIVNWFPTSSLVPVTLQTAGTLSMNVPLSVDDTVLGAPLQTLTLRGNFVNVSAPLYAEGDLSVLQPGDNVTALTFNLTGGSVSSATGLVFGSAGDAGDVTLLDNITTLGIPVTVASGGDVSMLALSTGVGAISIQGGAAGAGSTNVIGVLTSTGGITLQGGGGDDDFTLDPPNNAIAYNGNGGNDTLNITGTGGAVTYLLDAGGLEVNGIAVGGPLSFYAYFLTGTVGADTFAIDRSAADPVPVGGVTLNGAGGNDAFTVALGGPGGGGPVIMNGDAGDDELVVNFAGGTPTLLAPMTFNGGAQIATGDNIELTNGGSYPVVTHTFLNASDGAVVAGAGSVTINYTGLEPVLDNLSAVSRVFQFTGGAETITLSDDPGTLPGLSYIVSTLGESVTFANPSGSLQVDAGSGDDVVNFNGLDPAFVVPVTLYGGASADDDTFNVAPSANHTIAVDGGPESPADVLDLVLTGVTSPVFTPGAPNAGTWTFGNRQAVSMVSIENNVDFLPLVTLTVNNTSISEAGGTATFTATLSGIKGVPVTVTLGFSGTAVLNTDYTMSTTTIVIPANTLSAAATLTATNDIFQEGDETATVRIATVVGGLEAGVQAQTVTIVDNDNNALLSITKQANAPLGNLPGEEVQFTLTVSNTGALAATDIAVSDTLAAGFSCVCGEVLSEGTFNHTGEANGGIITWDDISLAPGESASLTFAVLLDVVRPAFLTNTAWITGSTPADPVTADDFASATVDVPIEANFPSGVQINDIAFSEDGNGDPIIVTGTINFGAYRGVTGQFAGEFFWLPASNGFEIPQYVTDVLRLVNGDILMATWGRAGLYRSDATARLWAPVDVTDPDITIVNAIAQSPIDGTIYISADGGQIFRSVDDGVTWVFMGRLPGGAADTPWSLVVDPDDDTIIYAGTFGNGVMVSHNRGKNWAPVDGNATLLANNAGHVFDMVFDPDAHVLLLGTGRGVWRSADGGDTWSLLDPAFLFGIPPDGPNPPEVRSLAYDAAGNLYVATWGNGVHVNTDPTGVGTFDPYALRGEFVFTVEINPGTGDVFMASRDAGMQFVLASATSNETQVEIPSEFVLEGNFPNPFNPTTNIRFAVPEAGNVRLSVYDLLGREVAVLVDGMIESGWHDVRFDASKLPSGAYLYRLETSQGAASRMLTLLK